MKKLITAIALLLAAVMLLTGCKSIDVQAKELVEKNLKEVQSGGFDEKNLKEITGGFANMGISDESEETLKEAVNTIAKKMTYTVKSSKQDSDDKNLYIVSVELKTVDTDAIFMNKENWKEILKIAFEQEADGTIDEDGLQKMIIDKWIGFISEQSKTAKTDKTNVFEFEVTYDKDTKMINTQLPYYVILGCSKDISDKLSDFIQEIAQEMVPE